MKKETGDYARKIQLADLLRGPAISRAMRDLPLGEGGRVLDAGCGTGSCLPQLAERVGRSGHVTGLDISAEMISLAGNRVAGLGLEDRVSFVQGDVNVLPFSSGEFDCAVSVDCVGYPYSLGPVTLLRELGRTVKPGGTLAILGWSDQQLLPGHPALEARLNTVSSLVKHPHAATGPGEHFMRAPGWFREAGFIEVSGKSYVGDILAPLSDGEKEAVAAFFEMLWEGARPALSEDEWRLFQALSDPGSDEYILDRPDYYGFFVYVRFSGRLPR